MSRAAYRLTRAAWFAVAVGVALRVYFIFQTPIGGDSARHQLSAYNDEIAHATYVSYIVEHGDLPGQVEHIQESGALQRGHFENYQPPLYYGICALVALATRAVGLEDITQVGRWLSCVAGMIILLLWIEVTATLALPASAASSGVIFLSLSGVMVRFGSMATNESLAWLCVGGIVLSALRIERFGWSSARVVALTIWIVLGLWTKLSILLALPLPLLALNFPQTAQRSKYITGWAILALLLTLPVWFRNVHEFGSLIPLGAGFGNATWRIPDFTTLAFAIRSFVFPWHEFWQGWLGFLFMLPLIMMFGWAVMRSGVRWIYARSKLLVLLAAIAIAGFVFLNVQHNQPEARYLFIAWPAIAMLFAASQHADSIRIAALLAPYALFFIPLAG